jgi:hypothetical protein
MGKTRHEKSYVDFDKPYERNIIGLRGIIYFGVGLFLLIVITFGLMALLLNVMEAGAVEADNANRNPMRQADQERLPPEPRLQAAPGFVVETADGRRVNLELKHPQAEWEVLEEEYKKLWREGQKTAEGTYAVLPIEEAKQSYLQQSASSPAPPQGQPNILEESKLMYSDSSSGRLATEKRR